jgi:hypothetical protein
MDLLHCREGLKMLLLAPLAFVRVILIMITLLMFATVCTFATVGAKTGEPYAPWRQRIVASSRGLGKLVMLFLGFWVKVEGWENYKDALRHGTVCASKLFSGCNV